MNKPEHADATIEAVLRGVFDRHASPTTLVNPDAAVVKALPAMLEETPLTSITVVARRDVLRALRVDFVLATTLADAVEDEELALFSVEEGYFGNSNLSVSADTVASLVPAGGRWVALCERDEAFVSAMNDVRRELVDEAGAFNLRTPGISLLEATAGTELGSAYRTDFQAAFEAVRVSSGDESRVDAVLLSLLVGAKSESLFYDLGRWAEDVGLASKATLSRRKCDLEARGLITTEKVPIEVGRPRHRLRLADEHIETAGITDLASMTLTLSS